MTGKVEVTLVLQVHEALRFLLTPLGEEGNHRHIQVAVAVKIMYHGPNPPVHGVVKFLGEIELAVILEHPHGMLRPGGGDDGAHVIAGQRRMAAKNS